MSAPRIAWYLRDPANLHYLAAMRPILDEVAAGTDAVHHLVVRPGCDGESHLRRADYQGVADLVVESSKLDDFDLVVSPSWLRDDERPAETPMVQAFHGLSDKPFTPARSFAGYTALLCIGQRQVDRLRANPANAGVPCHLVGWAKLAGMCTDRRVPGARTRVVYAPTWRKGGFSSIERFMADGVLDRLRRRFDVVVKPHPNLLNPARPFYDADIAAWLQGLDAVPGVRLSTTGNVLEELMAADVCVSDVSSASHEWLYFDRPLVVLNPQPGRLSADVDAGADVDVDADIESPTFAWQAAEVCDDGSQLADVVERALAIDRLGAVRQRLLHYGVHRPHDGRAPARAAAVIRDLLDG